MITKTHKEIQDERNRIELQKRLLDEALRQDQIAKSGNRAQRRKIDRLNKKK